MRKIFLAILIICFMVSISESALIDGLISYWKLDDTDDTNALDAHGDDDGTQDGTLDEETGIINTCFEFGGENGIDNVDCGDVDGIEGVGAFSISLWAKVPGASISQTRYMASIRGDGGRVFYLSANDSENVFFVVDNDSAGSALAYATDPFNDVADTWVHIVGVYDGTNVKVYADTVVGGTVGTLSGNTDSSTEPFTIGAESDEKNAWLGHIDEVAVWDRALSTDEIAELYNSGAGLAYPFTGEAPPAAGETAPNILIFQEQ